MHDGKIYIDRYYKDIIFDYHQQCNKTSKENQRRITVQHDVFSLNKCKKYGKSELPSTSGSLFYTLHTWNSIKFLQFMLFMQSIFTNNHFVRVLYALFRHYIASNVIKKARI